jgi:hypothetical protein
MRLATRRAPKCCTRSITFDHPRTKKKVTIEAPWPNDFQEALSTLREKAR